MLTKLTPSIYLTIALLSACGDPVGTSCHFTGSGFTASDNCRYRCLQHREVACPDGNNIRPKVCSGPQQCMPGGCPSGQTCYHINDPFNKESYCVSDNICGDQTPNVLLQWEKSSLAIAEKTLAEYAERKRQRTLKPTTITMPIDMQ